MDVYAYHNYASSSDEDAPDHAHSHEKVAVIVKLGGAAITEKDSLETMGARGQAVLAAAARSIAETVRTQRNVVVVHGAGSFGHFQAKEHGVAGGGVLEGIACEDGDATARLRAGVAKTRNSVQKLNAAVVSALIHAGVHAVGLSPFASWFTRGAGKHIAMPLTEPGFRSVTFCLDNGLVPVLHGDVAFDMEQDCAILSGDTILEHLSVFLRPERAVFITDVPGVFAEPPPTKSEPGTTPATLLGFVGVDQEDPKRRAESPLLVGGRFEVDEDGARRFVPAADSAETTEEMKRVSNAMRGASMWEFAAENARKADDASAPDVTGGIATKLRSAALVAALTNGGVDVFVTDYASGGGHAAIVGDVIVDGPRARRGTLKSSGERWVGTILGFGR